MVIITREDIRARITIGNLVIETPDVLNFSVSRSRSQPYANFNASIEVSPDDSALAVGEFVIIEAGLKGDLKRIFTGSIESSRVSPHWEKSDKFVLSVGGRDRMAEIDGKRFSRRQRCLGPGKLAIINGIVSKVQDKGRIRKDDVVGKAQDGGRFISGSLNMGDVPDLIKTRSIDTSNPYSLYAKSTKPANKPPDYNLIMDPSYDHLPQNGSRVITCSNCSSSDDPDDPTGGIEWNVIDSSVGTIVQDSNDPTKATYTQIGTGSNKVQVLDNIGKTGVTDISGILIHDHTRLGSGGPAYGIYRTG